MYRYQNNAFRILGVLPEVSLEKVLHKFNEIRVKKSIGMEIIFKYDFPWIGPIDRSEENITNALQRLKNPVSRLKEEIFWFWINTEEDKKALESLAQNENQNAHEIWNHVIGVDPPNKKNISAYINQTILSHSTVIAEEILFKQRKGESPSKKNIEFKNSHWKNWNFALSRFLKLNYSDVFWDEINKKVKRLNDQRLSESKIEEIHNQFLEDIVEINFNLISYALRNKNFSLAEKHINLLHELELPNNLLKKGIKKILSHDIQLLNKYCDEVHRKLSKPLNGKGIKFLEEVHSQFIDKITKIIDRCNTVDKNSLSDLPFTKDKIAETLRNISLDFNNRFKEYNKAYEIILEAYEYVISSSLKEKLENDIEIINQNAEIENSYKGQYEESGKTKWKNIIGVIGWAAFILICVILLIFQSKENSDSSHYSSSNNEYNRENEISETQPNLIDFHQKIKDQEKEITEIDQTLDSLKTKIKTLATDLNLKVEKTKYEKTFYIPSDINEKLKQKFDSLIAKYNDLFKKRKQIYKKYKENIEIYKNLVK